MTADSSGSDPMHILLWLEGAKSRLVQAVSRPTL